MMEEPNVVILDDIEVIRHTLSSKGLSLTLKVVAQAVRQHAWDMKMGDLLDPRIPKENVIQEYERVADKLDNQALGIQINFKKLVEPPKLEETTQNATTQD